MVNWVNEYKASLKNLEIEELLDLLIYRPLGFVIVKIIHKTSITPNHLTLVALACGIASGIIFAFGSSVAFQVGSILYFLFNVFDCSDGQLARLKRNGTPAGRIIDGVADYIAGLAVFLGIGIGFMHHAENPLQWWFLLSAAALSNIVHSIIVDNERLRYMHYAYGNKDAFVEELTEYRQELTRLENTPNSPWFDRFIIRSYLNYMQFSKTMDNLHRGPTLHEKKDKYQHAFKKIIKAWTFLGPTTHITLVVVAAFFMRPDLAAWIILLPFNLYWLLLYLFQKRKLKLFNSDIQSD